MRRRVAGVAVVALALALTGCTGGSGSRATLYDGLDALAADSAAVVVATVTDSVPDTDDTRLAVVMVDNVPDAPRLGETSPSGTVTIAVGDVLRVRQYTSDPALTVGAQYLLYLATTELPDDDADTFFVTGATAGLYARDDDAFVRVDPDSGDTLPATIDIAP